MSRKPTITTNTTTSHTHLPFDDIASNTVLKEVKTAIENINLNVGEIVVGDISVQSDDVGTHERLDTLNNTVSNKHLNSVADSVSVVGSVDVNNFPATQAVSGTVAVSNTSFEVSNFPATQTVNGSVSVSNFPTTQAVSGTVDVATLPAIGITNTSFEVSNFPATQAVSGTVAVSNTSFEVSNFPTTQAISGTVAVSSLPSIGITNTSFEVSNFPATQDVSGTVAVSSLPSIGITNTSFEVSNFPTTQPISGSVSISNLPATQPVSGTVAVSNTSFEVSNFPATQPISGSVSVSNLPATQPVSGTVAVSSLPAIGITNTSFEVSNFPATQPVSGTVAISNTSFEVSNFPATQPVSGTVAISSLPAIGITNTSFEVSNFPTTQPISGSVSVSNLPATQPVSGTVAVSTLPAIGITNTSFEVSNFPATQPVSGTVAVSTLPAIGITNTSFEVSNFPATQPVSGSVSVSNFPATQPVSGTVTVNTISGFSLDTTTQATNTKLDTIHADLDGLTFDGSSNLNVNIASGSISVSSVNIKDSAGNNLNSVSGSLNSNITNTSIDVHNYASSNGATWHHLNCDGNGQLNVHSKMQDGAGTDLTSTLIGAKQSLDVNVANTTAIPISGGISIINGSNTVDVLPTISSNLASNKGLVCESVLYGYSSSTGFIQNLTFTNEDTHNQLDVSDLLGNINLEALNEKANTLNTLVSAGNGVNAETRDNTASIDTKLDTTNNKLDLIFTELETETGLLQDIKNNTVSIDGKLLTTTNNKISGFPTNANIGLNMYVIPSKTQTFNFNALTENTGTNLAIGSNSSGIAFGTLSWGLANPKTWYMKVGGGSATDISITYTYIDTSGNEQTASAGPLTGVGITLPHSIITINKWKANKSLTSTDVVQIMAGTNTGVNSFCGGSLYNTNNSLFTCPNNAIAWVQSVQFSANVADNLRLYKWDVDGNRTVMYGWYGTANTQAYATGEYGFGGFITAGETIGWAGEVSTTRKNVYSNIVCRYL